jgi:hypothetical protein
MASPNMHDTAPKDDDHAVWIGVVIASEAKQSIATQEGWIASSQRLLAMTKQTMPASEQAYGRHIIVRDSNQLPLYFCLAGGVVGCVAAEIAWCTLGGFLWMPHWRQLRDYGMYIDDNGVAMGVVFVPPVVGLAFLVSTLLSLITVRWIGHPKLVFILLNLVPGMLLTLGEVNGILRGRGWNEPGLEIACLLIGLGWGAALYMLTVRRGGYAEG